MGDDEKLKIIIEAHNKAKAAFDEANRQVDHLEKNYKKMGDRVNAVSAKMRSAGKAMSIGLTLPILALGAAAAKSLMRIEQIGAQTDAVLKSTGNAANTTRAKIDELAGTLENLTGAEAESTTMGQNMLLTFTNIKNGVGKNDKIFDQATKTMLDMGTAMNGGIVPAGEQLKGTAIQLGKALNDPIKGISALSKVGVTFTQDQKDQIKTMVEAGDTMGAQKMILAELNKEFGGSAEAFGKTTAGKVEILKHRFGTLTETLMSQFMPIILKVVEKVSGAFDAFTKLSKGQQKLITILIGVAAALGPVLWIFAMLSTAIAFIVSPVGLVIVALAAMAIGLVLLYKKSEKFREIVAKIGKVIGEQFGDMIAVFKKDFLPAIQELWTKAQPILKVLGIILGVVVVGAILVVINVLKWFMVYVSKIVLPVLYRLGEVAYKVFNAIAVAVKWAWVNVIKPIWDVIYWYVTNILVPVWKKIFDAAKVVWNAIASLISLVWNSIIKPIWDIIWAYITNVLVPIWSKVWEAVKAAWNFMKPIFKAIWSYITNTLVPAFQKIWDKVSDVFTKAWTKISGWVTNIKGGFNKVKGWIDQVISKFTGIKDKVSTAFTAVGDSIKAPFKAAFNSVVGFYNKTLGKLNFSIPSWVPELGGKKWSMPQIEKLYKGTRNFAGGAAIVGDIRGQGGEIVNMPRGTDVFNNRESKRILRSLADGKSSGGGGLTVYGDINFADAGAVDRFFQRMDRQGELAAMGVPI